MKEIWTWIRELFNSEPEKQNKIQNNEFKNKGDINIRQENNSRTVNNNFVVHTNNHVSILDKSTVLNKNREYFAFIIVAFSPTMLLSFLQFKLQFFIGSWMALVLLVSIIIGLRVRIQFATRLETTERKWFLLLKKLEELMNIKLPDTSKQGFLYGICCLIVSVIYFYGLFFF